jgi:hypothetical protein
MGVPRPLRQPREHIVAYLPEPAFGDAARRDSGTAGYGARSVRDAPAEPNRSMLLRCVKGEFAAARWWSDEGGEHGIKLQHASPVTPFS